MCKTITGVYPEELADYKENPATYILTSVEGPAKKAYKACQADKNAKAYRCHIVEWLVEVAPSKLPSEDHLKEYVNLWDLATYHKQLNADTNGTCLRKFKLSLNSGFKNLDCISLVEARRDITSQEVTQQ